MLARLLLVLGSLPLAGFAVAQTDVHLPPHGHLPASVDLMPELERLGLTARGRAIATPARYLLSRE